jgi:hypothetical protein
MLEVFAEEYVSIGSSIQSVKDTFGVDVALEGPVPESVRATMTTALDNILQKSRELNLAVCANLADRALGTYRESAPTYRQVSADIQCLERSLHAELETRRFFFVPPERASYHGDDVRAWFRESPARYPLAQKLGPLIPALKAFPSIEEDMKEAGSCFAFDRHTASVFHLMRVMEVGLKAIAKALGVIYTSNWGICIAEIEKPLTAKKPDRFLAEAVAYLRSIKNAWRNPTMHIDRAFSEAEAERIFQAVGAFMLHLATQLSE